MNIDGVELSLDNLTQDLLELLVGERWPNGDEGAMRSLAAAWNEAAAQLDEIRQTASAAARQVGEHCQGANGESFQSFWSANFDDGQSSWPSGVAPAALPFAVRFCKSMADALNAGANQIETTKDTIMGNIAILVATVAPQIAAGFFDFGATDATAVAEILADRTAMQVLLDGAKELITEVVEQAIEQGLQQAELNFVIQFKEVMEGHAGAVDWSEVGRSGLSGAEGGALGTGFGFGLGKLGGKAFGEGFGDSVAGRMATGVASGGLTNASLDLIENGKISASDFTKGSLAGVLGGMGGAGAAAGEHPAIDTEHLPGQLTNPHSQDLTAGVLPTAHTDLSALAAPEVGTGSGADATAPTSAAMGWATAGWGGPAVEGGASSGTGADPGGGVPFDPSRASAATSSIARILGGGGGTQDLGVGAAAPATFGGHGSSAGRAPAEGDRPANPKVEASETATAAPKSAGPGEPAASTTPRGETSESVNLNASDRVRTEPSDAGVSDLPTRADGAGAPRGDSADPVRQDDAAQVRQDPAGETPVRSEPVADDAAAPQRPAEAASAEPGTPAHSTETASASAAASVDESRPTDIRPEDVARDASAPELDSAGSGHLAADARAEGADSDGLPAAEPSGPQSRGPSEPTRLEADAGGRAGDVVPPGVDGAARNGAEPGAPGREAPASPGSDAGGSKPVGSKPVDSKPDQAPPVESTADGSAAAGVRPDRVRNDGAAEPATATPRPDEAQREAPRGGADGFRSDSGSRTDSDSGADSNSNSDSGSGTRRQPVLLYQPDLGLGIGLRDRFESAGSWNPRQGLTGELAEVSARAEVGERGIANFSDRTMAELARKVPPDPDGAFTADIHGDARGVFSGLIRMTPEEYLRVLDANGHQPGQPIRLLSCEAGALDDGFAAQLARVSGCKVIAADTEVWSDETGHLFASGTHTDGFGEPAPDIPPSGTWREFSPDGTKTEVGADGFPPGQEEGFGNWGAPVGEVRSRDAAAQDPVEVARAALERLRGEWPELNRALTENPVARDSLLSHPDSVRMLNDALRDVRARLDAAGITDAVRGGETTAEVRAKVDSVIWELRAADPNQVLDRPERLAISRQIAAGTTRDGYRQSGFDRSRRTDPAYQEQCVDRLRADAPRSQERLNAIVREIARDNGGEASWRPQVKDRARALKKVREYVEEVPDGDASLLVDVVGAKIRFGSVDELYRALDALKSDPRLEIVRIKDRVARATESGNRSILMNVRLAGGQVAELKFGLKSFEAPAAAEHPLYEVRRDLDSIALTEHRPPTPVESLIKAATEAHARRAYGAAWNREMAGSRLHEVLADHRDVVSIAQRLVFDSAVHPTNVAESLADPATREATIAAIGELADGRVLSGRTLDEYRAANPGRGPLFEPVDPSVNTTADGRDRKTVFLGEAKRVDPARDVGATATPEETARLNEYARRLREEVQPAVEEEVRRLAEQVGDGASVSIRTKSADGILDKVDRMTTGSPSRPARPDYRAGDVIDAVGARITTRDMHDLAQILEAAKSRFGVGDGGRILEIDNMYASPKSKNPAYRVIPLVVRVEVDGRPYTFELQLTTRRASIAADLEHNTLFKPYVEMSREEKATVRGMLAEAAALDQEETRWNQ